MRKGCNDEGETLRKEVYERSTGLRKILKRETAFKKKKKKKKKKARSIFPSWILWSIGLGKLVTQEFIY